MAGTKSKKEPKGKSGSSAPYGGKMHPHPEALYYHVALAALDRARKENDEFERKKSVVTAIVFSALCLEAFVNQEYAPHPVSKKILERDDRISLETKWLLLPLVLGADHTFDTGVQPFQTFHDLIRTRNQRLVHFTPQREIHETPEGRKQPKGPYWGELVNDVGLAERYVNWVAEMIRALNQLTSDATSVPEFLSGSKYLSHVSAWVRTSYESR